MRSCCDEPQLLPVAEALSQMLAAVPILTETETVPLTQALDRILAAPIYAAINVPAHANSAMDGYALCAADFSTTTSTTTSTTGSQAATDEQLAQTGLRLVGTALAGHTFVGHVEPGCCVRIMTGALIPAGADTVVMQENTRTENDRIYLTQAPRLGENIRQAGEDISVGNLVAPQGQRLGPIELALLASQGMAQLNVLRPLRVAVLSTGDELIAPGLPLPAGHIYDSNRYGIIAHLQRLGVSVVDLGLIPDQPDAIRQAFNLGAQCADAIISSGGVSVGEADFVKDLLTETGQVNFWKVAIKPGKPFAFGKLEQSYFFGLPGNPVSAMVTLQQLVQPILQAMMGERSQPPLMLHANAATRFKKRPGRIDYQRATLSCVNGDHQVTSNGPQGSGVLTSFSNANCYVVLESERGTVEVGEQVSVLPFDRYIR